VVVIGLVSIILLLPVTVAGIGLREGSLVGLMGALGQDAAATLAMSLVILALSLFAAAIGLALDLTSRDRTVSGA
jgi:preprotein translocase subunit SecG